MRKKYKLTIKTSQKGENLKQEVSVECTYVCMYIRMYVYKYVCMIVYLRHCLLKQTWRVWRTWPRCLRFFWAGITDVCPQLHRLCVPVLAEPRAHRQPSTCFSRVPSLAPDRLVECPSI